MAYNMLPFFLTNYWALGVIHFLNCNCSNISLRNNTLPTLIIQTQTVVCCGHNGLVSHIKPKFIWEDLTWFGVEIDLIRCREFTKTEIHLKEQSKNLRYLRLPCNNLYYVISIKLEKSCVTLSRSSKFRFFKEICKRVATLFKVVVLAHNFRRLTILFLLYIS